MTIAVTCQACGENFSLRDELAGRTVRCRCGKPLRVPGSAADSLVELLDDELSRPYEPPPERQAPAYQAKRRRWRGAKRRRERAVVSQPTSTQLLLWTAGGMTGWLLSLALIPTTSYLCVRAMINAAVAEAVMAGVLLGAMLVFNRGSFGLLLRSPKHVGLAQWGGVLAALCLVAAGMFVQVVRADAGPAARSELQLAGLFSNLAIAVMFAVVPGLTALAASLGPKVKSS